MHLFVARDVRHYGLTRCISHARRSMTPDCAQCLKSSSFTIDSFGVATPQDFQLANVSGPYTWFNASQYEVQAPKCASKTPAVRP